MGKQKTLTKKEIRTQLKEKFFFEDVKGSKHGAVSLFHNGKKVATTRFSRGGSDDVPDSILGRMAKEIRIVKTKFFKEMIECTKSREAYMEELEKGGFLPSEE